MIRFAVIAGLVVLTCFALSPRSTWTQQPDAEANAAILEPAGQRTNPNSSPTPGGQLASISGKSQHRAEFLNGTPNQPVSFHWYFKGPSGATETNTLNPIALDSSGKYQQDKTFTNPLEAIVNQWNVYDAQTTVDVTVGSVSYTDSYTDTIWYFPPGPPVIITPDA